jgi:hypothetical protein
MERSELGRILWRAADDDDFRRRALLNLGMALAEEGFILTDAEMREIRYWWDEIETLSPRASHERIQALARAYRR